MEPRIRYAMTSDGVSIAYWRIGEGRRLLLSPPMVFSHLTLEWQYPPLRAWYEQLARDRTVLRWDPRCYGLSERGTPGPMSNMLDVEAVLNRVPGEPCDIVATAFSGNSAIEYAAAHPKDVANLVIVGPKLRGEQLAQGQLGVIADLAERDQTLWSENMARWVLGWESGSLAHAFAEFIQASVNQEDVQRALREMVNFDRMSILPQLSIRTLVLSNPLTDWDRQHARHVAAAIPEEELVEVENPELRGPAFMNASQSMAINEFLGLTPDPREETTLPSGTAVILFLDIAGSTALTTKLGDAAYRERERTLDASLRSAIREAGGTPVEGKVLGDGVMAVFTSARQAIDAAQRCRDLGNDAGLPLHLGIHAGDVVREGNNVHGGAVQLASRVQSVAAPGEILVSATVRDLARTSAGVTFEDRGEHELKGIAEPQRLFAVREQV